MENRHTHEELSDQEMTKRRAAESKASRKASNAKVNESLQGMYNDVVNEPVPEGMANSIPQDEIPES